MPADQAKLKKAIIFGASGFVGSFLLNELLSDPDYSLVTAFVRKDLGIINSKLNIVLGDYNSLDSLKGKIVADDVFITLGTTTKNTPDPKLYYQIDHYYPVLASKVLKENGATSVFFITSVGSNPHSAFSYIKSKGETERDILALNFDRTGIFRPSMIMGSRIENRGIEKLYIKIWQILNPFLIGSLKKWKGINGKDIALAMHNTAKEQDEKVKIYHWSEMMEAKTNTI